MVKLTVTGCWKTVPSGPNWKSGERPTYPVGTLPVLVTVIIVLPGSAPTGIPRATPDAVTVPPPAPTVCVVVTEASSAVVPTTSGPPSSEEGPGPAPLLPEEQATRVRPESASRAARRYDIKILP
jgi:hypothetical protein